MTSDSTTAAKRIYTMPVTNFGKWAVGLAIANVLLMFSWSFLPGGGWPGLLCGLAGGVLALIAVLRQKERSWLVYLAILPLLGVIAFLLGEVLIPH